MATFSAGFKPVRQAGAALPSKTVRRPTVVSKQDEKNMPLITAQQNAARLGAQQEKNFDPYIKPAMQTAQDERNAKYFGAYAAEHPGAVDPSAPMIAPGAPGGVAAGGTPGPNGAFTPFDAAAETQISDRQKATQLALAALGGEKATANLQFYDPNNPMSRQAELKRQFDQLSNQQHYGQASSGQLYSGSSATENALDDRDRGFGEARLMGEYTGVMNAIEGRERQTKTDSQNDIDGIIRGVTEKYAGDVDNTPKGTGDTEAAAVATNKRTPAMMMADNAQLKARVKAKLLAKKKAGK